MSFRTSVTIVASPHPRVGKTLLARLLHDFHRHEGRAVAGFDLNRGNGALQQFLPEHTVSAGVGDIRGQMALFDSLVAENDTAKIVDLGVDSYEAFFALAEQIGLTEEAVRRGIAPAILFLQTPDHTAIEAYRALQDRFPAAMLVPVYNDMFGQAQHRDSYAPTAREAVVRLPALPPSLRKYVETPPFSFADAQLASATGIPLDGHIELQRWLRRIYLAFRELNLRILLANLQSSMRQSS